MALNHNFFDNFNVSSDDILRVSHIDFNIDYDLYDYYTVNGDDNLMNIAHKVYDNQHLWWALYIFNNITSTLDTFLSTTDIKESRLRFKDRLENYNILDFTRKHYVDNIVIAYYDTTELELTPNDILDLLVSGNIPTQDILEYYSNYIFAKYNKCGVLKVPPIESIKRMKIQLIEHKNRIKRFNNS